MPIVKKPTAGWNVKGVTTHPGAVLSEEFLKPMQISQNKLAMDIHVPATRIGDIVHGRRGISPDTALRLARYFGNSPEFWLNLHQSYELSKTRMETGATIEQEVRALV